MKDLVCRVYVYTPHVNGFNNIAASEIDSCKRAHIATLRSSALSRFVEHIVTSEALFEQREHYSRNHAFFIIIIFCEVVYLSV